MPPFSPPSRSASIPPAPTGGNIDLSGPSPAAAKTLATDPDPNFYPYEDAVPGEYIVTFADGAYTPPTDPNAPPGGASTNVVATDPVDPIAYPVSDDGSDAPAVAAAICDSYSATRVDAFDYVGGFPCKMTEDAAQAMSHDSRVSCVGCQRRDVRMRPGRDERGLGPRPD